ncbi:hypothetical protein FJR45_05155 [Sulfurimonas sediminis]|uniref:PDGLE domain-containing protein n=1 Tax=Sulfurimonas sediminis TaxID=2590020 RepID=A0A7M1B160_9BACT|nr:PDGLE domain-containing protein [Sulfurimonas sediminis]QOP43370.1 hypothetical protein FJR45_05155 [Sulfurimonas sediminis]
MKNKLYLLLSLLIVAVPLGLLSENPAWGEWEEDYYEKILGFIPTGIKNAHTLSSPLPDYSINGMNEVVSYYLSALLGLVLVYGIFYIFTKITAKKQDNHGSA